MFIHHEIDIPPAVHALHHPDIGRKLTLDRNRTRHPRKIIPPDNNAACALKLVKFRFCRGKHPFPGRKNNSFIRHRSDFQTAVFLNFRCGDRIVIGKIIVAVQSVQSLRNSIVRGNG